MKRAPVYSIFKSIDGEVNDAGQGALTTFIRFASCNLRCQYPCDTPYSFDPSKAKMMTIEEVVSKVKEIGLDKVTITGGEPLLHKDFLKDLVEVLLYEHNIFISLETNGSIKWEDIDVMISSLVVDYKLKSSGMTDQMLPVEYFSRHLSEQDFIKFVIADEEDFSQALTIYDLIANKYDNKDVRFGFSPVWGKLDPLVLLQWMTEKKLQNSNLNLQLHKMLGLVEDK